VILIDHPQNPGYPTYWHARGYGLFAANTLGQAALSNGKDELNFQLKKENRLLSGTGLSFIPAQDLTPPRLKPSPRVLTVVIL
jgi:hypothetical protein